MSRLVPHVPDPRATRPDHRDLDLAERVQAQAPDVSSARHLAREWSEYESEEARKPRIFKLLLDALDRMLLFDPPLLLQRPHGPYAPVLMV